MQVVNAGVGEIESEIIDPCKKFPTKPATKILDVNLTGGLYSKSTRPLAYTGNFIFQKLFTSHNITSK